MGDLTSGLERLCGPTHREKGNAGPTGYSYVNCQHRTLDQSRPLSTPLRERVTIVNRKGLEEAVCDCYRLLQQYTKEWQGQSLS